MRFTTKVIIFLAGIAVLAMIASVIVPVSKYLAILAGLAILIVLAYKLFVVLFVKNSNSDNKDM